MNTIKHYAILAWSIFDPVERWFAYVTALLFVATIVIAILQRLLR